MNVLQIKPIDCFISGLRVNAFGNMFAMMAINGLVIAVSGIAYGVRKVIILRKETLTRRKGQENSLRQKRLCTGICFLFCMLRISTPVLKLPMSFLLPVENIAVMRKKSRVSST